MTRSYVGSVEQRLLQETDTGRVFVLAVLLEEFLTVALGALLIDGAGSVVKSLSGRLEIKVSLAWGVGLISDQDAKDLRVITNVRNRFAHRALDGTFNDPDVAPLIDQLARGEGGRHSDIFMIGAVEVAERVQAAAFYAARCRQGALGLADLKVAAEQGFPMKGAEPAWSPPATKPGGDATGA